MQSPGIPLSWAVRQSAGAVAAGVSQAALFERSTIEPRFGDDRDEISPAQYVLLCMNTAFGVEDAVHGLGSHPVPARYSAMGLRVMLGCSTLEGALQALTRLYSMASSTLRLQLRIDHDEAALMVHCDSPTATQSVFLEDNYLSWMFMHCGQFLGRPLPLNGITTRDPAHISLNGRHYAMKARVCFGNVSELRFPRALLAVGRAGHETDDAFWDCMRPWLEFIESDIAPGRAITTGELRLDALARKANVSSATMRRRMAVEGGLRRARRRALVEEATKLLAQESWSVERVAEHLGYADAASFRRFLKSATGRTPQAIRERQRSCERAATAAVDVHERIRRMCQVMDRL